jgi:hypothetical protein
MAWSGRLAVLAAAGGGVVAGYLGLVTGAVTLDVGVGRRARPLGPQTVSIAAPRVGCQKSACAVSCSDGTGVSGGP